MEPVIDIESLAAPIGEESPCGEDPREDASFESPYQKLRDAREEAMDVERVDRSTQSEDEDQGFVTDIGKWRTVVDLASSILQDSAKDLEVCALLVEGLARTEGAAGMRDGFLVTSQLVENYWEQLFPRLDPDDPDSLEDRVAAFAGLNGGSQQGPLARYIVQMAVTEGGPDGDYHSHQFDRIMLVNRNPDAEAREAQISALGYTLEDVERAAASTPGAFFVTTDQELGECRDALRSLDQAFMNVCKFDAPPSSMIASALESVSDAINFLGKDKIAAYKAAQEAAEAGETVDPDMADGENTGAAAGRPQGGSGAIVSREDAISRMRVIARYFRESEPHSPVSYALENVIRWSSLPLDRLLEEWIEDESARSRYMLMTGINRAGEAED